MAKLAKNGQKWPKISKIYGCDRKNLKNKALSGQQK